jgi:lipopolysaccharide transport system ATP-binding protein
MKSAIKVENISKQYVLGLTNSGSLRETIQSWFSKPQIENENIFNALTDVSFDVNDGDIVGIIGKNGAGKSTLLKILSQITQPTNGRIEINGRVASLLEVGTGFHPELTGRENVYLNGNILGMSRVEVKQKFDEIVAFSGVEKFIDTPVKRYSSGMYVRLAFAVAAHLEPEILIIDEVLAVGDAEFQKRCLGKMKSIAGEGRTVLFVSHNMNAVQSLCGKCIYIKNGELVAYDKTENVIDHYLSANKSSGNEKVTENQPNKDQCELLEVSLNVNGKGEGEPLWLGDKLKVEIKFKIGKEMLFNLSMKLKSGLGDVVLNTWTNPKIMVPGLHSATLHIPPNFLNDLNYSFDIFLVGPDSKVLLEKNDILRFSVNEERREGFYHHKVGGLVRPELNFVIN